MSVLYMARSLSVPRRFDALVLYHRRPFSVREGAVASCGTVGGRFLYGMGFGRIGLRRVRVLFIISGDLCECVCSLCGFWNCL